MAGYTDPFGGSAIYPAQTAFRAVTLTANTQLSWPSVATDENYVARSMRVNATAGSLSLTMPDATAVSPGFDVIFTNSGANTYTVRDNAGVAICTVAVGQSQYVQLTGNGTAAGTWLTLQFAASASTATASALAGAGLQVDPSDANRLSPKRTVIAFTDAARVITASTDLGALLDWTGGTATWAPGAGSDAAAMGQGFFFGLRNSGTGTLSFDGGGSQVDDAAAIALQPGEACEVVSNGSEWRTIGLGRSNSFAFSRLSKAVNPSGAFSLSAAECANNIHRYTGALSGNVTVTYQPVTQVYFVQNSTTGAFTVTLTTGSGTTQALSAGQSMVVVCDGTNMIDATTVTVGGFANGSAAAPAMFFTSDTNTGIYRVGADQLGFATGGVLGAVVDSGQRLLLGPTTSRSVGGAARRLQLEAASADIAASIVRNSNDTAGPDLVFGKSRATALGGVTAAASQDLLGNIRWSYADGAAMTDTTARIYGRYEGGGAASIIHQASAFVELQALPAYSYSLKVYQGQAGFTAGLTLPTSISYGQFNVMGTSASPVGFGVENLGAGGAGYYLDNSYSGLSTLGALSTRLHGLLGVTFSYGAGFTEGMRLSNAGQALLGTSAAIGSEKLRVAGGDIQLDNATYLRTLTSALTTTRIIGLNASDVFYIGGIDAAHGNTLFVNGGSTLATLTSTGALTLNQAASMGYGTGAGGTVTQITSKATGVTLNRPSGQITMNGAALAAATAVSFTLTNSVIGTTDVVYACIDSAATAGAYTVTVDAVGAGTCQISLRNHTAGSLSEAVVLNFVVLRAATA